MSQIENIQNFDPVKQKLAAVEQKNCGMVILNQSTQCSHLIEPQ